MKTFSRLYGLLLSDEGRLPRMPFWLYIAGAALFAVVFVVIGPMFGMPARLLPFAASLLLIYPSFCVLAKRLHDLDINGAWAIGMAVVAAVDSLWVALGSGLGPSLMMVRSGWWWVSLANLVAFVILGLIPGDDGHNRFGEKPAR